MITRLGEGVDWPPTPPTALARVRNALVDFAREAAELGAERTLLVATSAVRDADDGEAFLGEIESYDGFATRLLDGREEAELAFRGVRSAGLARVERSCSTWAAARPSSSSAAPRVERP